MGKDTKKTEGAKRSIFSSVKFKLIAVMMLVALAPLIVAIIVSTINSVNKALEDAESINSDKATIVEQQFMTAIDQQLRSLQALAESPYTIDYIKDASSRNETEMVAYLQKINEPYNDGNSIVVTGADGMQIVRSDGGKLSDISEREFFQGAMKGNVYLSSVMISKATGSRIIVPAVPVFDYGYGSVIGVAQRSYDLSVLHDLLVSNISGTQRIFVTDKNGIVVAHSDYEISADDEEDDRSQRPFYKAVYSENKDSGTYVTGSGSEKKIVSYLKEPNTGWIIVVSSNYGEAMAASTRSALTIIIIGVILGIVAAVLSFMMAKSFIDPLGEVNNALSSLADGRFVSIKRFTNRKDEFGEMVNNTNTVLGTLGDIVKNIKESAVAVNKSSEDLAETADQISQTADDVSTAVQEIASGATQQADEIQSVTESVGEIDIATGNVQTSTDDLSNLAGKMQSVSTDSAQSLGDLQESSHSMSEKIRQITEKIGATSKAVENINEKVEGITNIATQTNLLSLNASIEAARAGEAGKGFAVVAGEIGKLAEDSRLMADEIRKEMDELLVQSQSAVEMAAEVQKGNEEQETVLGATVDSVNAMIGDISSTVTSVKSIETDAGTCVSAKNVVADAMSSLSAISQENAASSEETGASMQELSATVTTLAASANTLKEIAEKLSSDMEFFKD